MEELNSPVGCSTECKAKDTKEHIMLHAKVNNLIRNLCVFWLLEKVAYVLYVYLVYFNPTF